MSVTPRIGVAFDGFIETGQALDLARMAGAAGADSLWMAEHMGYREAAVSSMGFLMTTDKARVVPTAMSPYLWHPTPTAMSLATLAEAGGGRTAVAVATGNPMFLKESGQDIVKPIAAVREFIECLRALWSGEAVTYDGQFFTLAGARMAFTPPRDIPVYIAAMGDQMLRLAGRIGDGVALSAGLSADNIKQALETAAQGADKAGRNITDLRRAAYIYFGPSGDGKSSFEILRGKLAFLMRNKFIAESAQRSGIDIDPPRIIDAVARRDLDEATRLVPDEAVEAFTITGTAKQCADRLLEYVSAGVDEPVLSIVGGNEGIELALGIIADLSSGPPTKPGGA
jgi:5,10-methylenetetrahydromethanopterin reductase